MAPRLPPHSLASSRMSLAITSSFFWASPCTLPVPASPSTPASAPLFTEWAMALQARATVSINRRRSGGSAPCWRCSSIRNREREIRLLIIVLVSHRSQKRLAKFTTPPRHAGVLPAHYMYQQRKTPDQGKTEAVLASRAWGRNATLRRSVPWPGTARFLRRYPGSARWSRCPLLPATWQSQGGPTGLGRRYPRTCPACGKPG